MVVANINIFQILSIPVVIWSATFGICNACSRFGLSDLLYDSLEQGKTIKTSTFLTLLMVPIFLIVWVAINLIELLGRA